MQKILVLFLILTIQLFSSNSDLLNKGRLLYHQSVEDEEKIEEATQIFNSLKNIKEFKGVSITYLGSIEMLKGKHAFWPQDKMSYVNSGLEIMEAGLKKDPTNLESLFIYGSTCYYLPFFFNKKDDAKEKLLKIVSLIDRENVKTYNRELLQNALLFIKEKLDLDSDQKAKLNLYLDLLAEKK